ncbi:Coproporphyrinogen oxidase [Forsythia ovata]|uniref:coproporphyrinogen oxidase n=1 Tax=Forsythia ovata TaxID=205694 RepID=A0ABD1WK03_9LAMI
MVELGSHHGKNDNADDSRRAIRGSIDKFVTNIGGDEKPNTKMTRAKMKELRNNFHLVDEEDEWIEIESEDDGRINNDHDVASIFRSWPPTPVNVIFLPNPLDLFELSASLHDSTISEKMKDMSFTDRDKACQQLRRGCYVYDRGTTFGLKIDRRIESIPVSLPLIAR